MRVDSNPVILSELIDARRPLGVSAMSEQISPDRERRPSERQIEWLARGAEQPGGKLPLFDLNGARVNPRAIKSCLEHGWAERWFANPLKPEWLVCRLTGAGRSVLRGRGEDGA